MAYPQTTFRKVTFRPDSFWAKKRKRISTTAILYQLDVLKSTGRYDAFRMQWKPIYDEEAEIWPVPKHLFWDSDVAKWIEGACYFLAEEDNETVRAAVDELVDMISRAQQSDGYLNIHFSLVDPKGRFSNLRDLHELYNAGHLIEAALAHEHLYGNRKLLDPLIRYVDLFFETFGPLPKKPGYPGHPEIELALLRLYDRTHDVKHLQLAQFFITERGNPNGIDGKHYYTYEAEKRGEGEHEVPDFYPAARSYWYQQAHLPLVEQTTIEGHSVRAMYLLTALADLIRTQGNSVDRRYSDALYRLWDNMVGKKMYLTGGIGSVKQWEGFGIDYHLPQTTDEGGCYAETCASIGVIMLADRLLEMDRDRRFADIMELELYNAVLTGVSCDGRSWTYVNQLASCDEDPSRRSDWFTVACCPPNVLRLLGDLGGYFFSSAAEGLALDVTISLYSAMEIVEEVQGQQVTISMQTDWPNDGRVAFEIACPEHVTLRLHLRIPGWADNAWEISPTPSTCDVPKGYLNLDPTYLRQHASFTLNFPMKARFLRPHPFTGQSVAAVQRGPLIYCVEDVDNPWVEDHFKSISILPDSTKLNEERVRDDENEEEYVRVAGHGIASQADWANLKVDFPGLSVKTSDEGEPRWPRTDASWVTGTIDELQRLVEGAFQASKHCSVSEGNLFAQASGQVLF